MQVFVNGIVGGVPTALLGIAFSLVYLSARAFHLALGGIYAVVPFIALTVMDLGADPLIAVAMAVFAGILLSAGCELLNYAPLERRGASPSAHLVTSLGIYIILIAASAIIWTSEAQTLRAGVDATRSFGPVMLTQSQLITAATGGGMLVAFVVLLRYTRFGLKLRALSDNPAEFALRGFDGQRMRLASFAISGLLGAAAALLVARDVGFSVNGGLSALLIAVVAVIVGGRGTFAGPILGAFLISVLRAEVTWYMAARWQDAATFGLLALILYVRPAGLLGARGRVEATV